MNTPRIESSPLVRTIRGVSRFSFDGELTETRGVPCGCMRREGTRPVVADVGRWSPVVAWGRSSRLDAEGGRRYIARASAPLLRSSSTSNLLPPAPTLAGHVVHENNDLPRVKSLLINNNTRCACSLLVARLLILCVWSKHTLISTRHVSHV